MQTTSNKSKQLLQKLCKILYITGSPNYWFEDLGFSGLTCKIHDYLYIVTNGVTIVLIISIMLANFTQKHLTKKQASDAVLYSSCFPILFFNMLYINYHIEMIRNILFNFIEKSKRFYHDKEVELEFTRKTKFYIVVFCCITTCMLTFYGFEGLVQSLTTENTFTTLITAWPNVKDISFLAKSARISVYFLWWIFVFKVSPVYLLVFIMCIGLRYQFKQLCSYFYSLDDIFKSDLRQNEKELQYEKSIKLGIKLHVETLECTNIQHVTTTVFGGQIVITLSLTVMLMAQMLNSDRTMANTLTILLSLVCVMISTACFFWNAGDVTVEAANLSTAIFSSGWQNCTSKSSVRIRKLLTVAIARSQEHVVLKTMYTIAISYDVFVTILKSSYSVFSVIY